MNEEKTRLESAHKRWHSEVARLVSPPYTGTPEEYKKIKPAVDAAAEEFRLEFLKDKDETIEFLSRNRLEVENFFGDLLQKFDCQEVYDTLYGYYERNFRRTWTREKIEEILRQKCGIESDKYRKQ